MSIIFLKDLYPLMENAALPEIELRPSILGIILR